MTNGGEPIAVVGGGRWGTALAQLAAEAGRNALLWRRDAAKAAALNATRRNEDYWPEGALHENVRATADPAEVAAFARLLFVAVPSHAFRAVVAELGGLLGGDHIVISAVRGIEEGTNKRMTEILREETPVKRMGALSGPNLAVEVLAGQPSATVVASKFPEVVARAQGALVSERFRVYGSADPIGVEYAGALNNIIAVIAGFAQGLGLGDSTLAMVISRGAAEIRRFGVARGAQADTFNGLAGIGDLMLRCAGAHSVERQAGMRIARGEKPEDVLTSLTSAAESARTVRAVCDIARRDGIEMPLTRGAHALLYENADPADLRRILMKRSAKYE